ncbi:MAG: DUF2089 family protein [Anaerolineae bacterium]
MPAFPGKCPICSGSLTVTEALCRTCGVTLRGEFEVGPFDRLDPSQAEFLRLFVLSRGNLRRLKTTLKVSYPTVRARLDDLISAIEVATDSGDGR